VSVMTVLDDDRKESRRNANPCLPYAQVYDQGLGFSNHGPCCSGIKWTFCARCGSRCLVATGSYKIRFKFLDDIAEIQFEKFFHLQRYRRGDVSNW